MDVDCAKSIPGLSQKTVQMSRAVSAYAAAACVQAPALTCVNRVALANVVLQTIKEKHGEQNQSSGQ